MYQRAVPLSSIIKLALGCSTRLKLSYHMWPHGVRVFSLSLQLQDPAFTSIRHELSIQQPTEQQGRQETKRVCQ